MIELLILYSLNKRERTLYSLRSDIIEKFGYITKPSIGTIHPALKRLLAQGVVTIRNDFSSGGKKSTFWGLSQGAMKHFKDLYFESFSENPTLLFVEIQTKLAVISLLLKEDREVFLKDLSLKLESYLLDLKNTDDDEYIELDEIQRNLLKKNISDVQNFIEFIENKVKKCLQ